MDDLYYTGESIPSEVKNSCSNVGIDYMGNFVIWN